MTNEDRQFLAMWRRAPPAEREAMRELMIRWRNGAGPDVAAADAWLRNKVAEIKARDKARRLACTRTALETVERLLIADKNAG